MKRIVLFLATNLAIIFVLSITASLLGFENPGQNTNNANIALSQHIT